MTACRGKFALKISAGAKTDIRTATRQKTAFFWHNQCRLKLLKLYAFKSDLLWRKIFPRFARPCFKIKRPGKIQVFSCLKIIKILSPR